MIIELLYRWRLKRQEQIKRERNVIFITDLIRCPLKRIYEDKFPELTLSEILNPASILGDLVHLGLEDIIKDFMKNCEVIVEEEFEKVVELEGEKYYIRGRPDIVLKASNRVMVVEIKSSRSDINIPYQHHILQTQLYAWLVNAKEGILIYVTPDRISEYSLSQLNVNVPTDDDVRNMIKELVTITTAPKYKWECKYCRFSSICPNKVT